MRVELAAITGVGSCKECFITIVVACASAESPQLREHKIRKQYLLSIKMYSYTFNPLFYSADLKR